jgi:hypothetical protein
MSVMALPETTARFPVVMLYDHFNSVAKAMATYSYLTHELENEFTPDLRIWRMDDATSVQYSAQANDDIAAAEVIIMTMRGDEPFPAAFRHWKSGISHEGLASPHAVIAMIGSVDDVDPAADTWNSVLRGAATRIHPEVFVYEPRLDESVARANGTEMAFSDQIY